MKQAHVSRRLLHWAENGPLHKPIIGQIIIFSTARSRSVSGVEVPNAGTPANKILIICLSHLLCGRKN
ncbi:hypothetical protein GDO78_005011 [Eleutherodactylus coqui]|uniref:Uncharacterized protein n=1 Tax=Eleutherodactylus coqui TaxID=57060 RepID=A0A8J6FLD4_ELECQ|nr:hypothetical protein GDO78_005011 [Eleutherodactylus coqui]